MAYKSLYGILLVIFTNILINSLLLHTTPQVSLTLGFLPSVFLLLHIAMATSYLLFPFFGWVGDRLFKRYHIILIALATIVMATASFTVMGVTDYYYLNSVQNASFFKPLLFILAVIFCFAIGFIYTNILQLGYDQIIIYSAKLIRSLASWYYWSLIIGPLCIYYILVIMYLNGVFPERLYKGQTYFQTGGGAALVSTATQLVFGTVAFFGLLFSYRHLNMISPSNSHGKTSLSLIAYILMEFLRQKLSQITINSNSDTNYSNMANGANNSNNDTNYSTITNRANNSNVTINSNITNNAINSNNDINYNEESRVPHSDLQIEKTKQFLHIFIIILSLSAYHLSGDTYSLGEELIRIKGACPSIYSLLIVGIDPNHVPHLVVFLTIPLCQTLRCFRKEPKLSPLQKMFCGLLCCMAAICIEMCLRYILGLSNNDNNNNIEEEGGGYLTNKFDNFSFKNTTRFTQTCFAWRLSNDSTETPPHHGTNYAYWWLLLPQILFGFSKVLVSMVTLEFICTQSSSENRGFLIGVWYSTKSIQYLLSILDAYIYSSKGWYILKANQFGLSVILTLLYCFVIRNYVYKEDEEETLDRMYTDTRNTPTCRVVKVTRGGRSYGAV